MYSYQKILDNITCTTTTVVPFLRRKLFPVFCLREIWMNDFKSRLQQTTHTPSLDTSQTLEFFFYLERGFTRGKQIKQYFWHDLIIDMHNEQIAECKKIIFYYRLLYKKIHSSITAIKYLNISKTITKHKKADIKQTIAQQLLMSI